MSTTAPRTRKTPAKRTVGKPSDTPFVWTTAAGETVTVPSMAQMDPTMDAVEEYATAVTAAGNNPIADGAANMRFLRRCLPDEQAAEIAKIRLSEFQAFLAAWSAHSGVALGESPAS